MAVLTVIVWFALYGRCACLLRVLLNGVDRLLSGCYDTIIMKGSFIPRNVIR